MQAISIITYAKEKQLELVLKNHQSAISAYAWIKHDKDNKEPHIHLYMRFNSDRRPTDVQKWFENCTDEKDEPANTLWQKVKCPNGLIAYLTHSNEPNKYQYPETEVHYSSEEAKNELLEEFNEDNGFDALQQMLDNVPLRDIARKHGRDFIRYYNSYKQLAEDIRSQERRRKKDEELLLAVSKLEQSKKEMLIKIKAIEQDKIDPDTGEIL